MLRDYGLHVHWQLRRLSWWAPLIMIVQVLLAVGIIVGFGYLLPEVDPRTALYLSTGAPTVLLVTVGLVIVPQSVGQAKTEGSYGWMRTLPVPRLAFLAADATVWFAAMLPGLAIALGVAAWHYDLAFSVSPLVVPAVLLVGLTATGVGLPVQGAARKECERPVFG